MVFCHPFRRSGHQKRFYYQMSTYRPQRGCIPFSSLGGDRWQRFHVKVSSFARFHHRYLNYIIRRKCPKINLKLRAPLELENLLPYNLQYRIYDKDADQNWRSYLRKGGIMPVHSVELGHLVLLNVDVQDTGKPTRSHAPLVKC